MRRKHINLLLLIVLISTIGIFGSCKDKNNNKPIARAYDSYLYPDDLKQIIHEGSTRNDSLTLVQAYIDQWQREQILLHNAKQNTSLNLDQIEKQIQEYRNSLIIYEYEQALIQSKLDTLVTEEEISSYYTEHEEIFILKRPIFKVSFIELPSDAPEIDRVKKWFSSSNEKEKVLLNQYCKQYSPNYLLNDTSWYYLEELAKMIPITHIDENNYRNYGQIFNINENNRIYLIILRDSKFKDSRSPLDIEKENIRNLIINQRKVALLNQQEQQLINAAKSKNNIEVYNQ